VKRLLTILAILAAAVFTCMGQTAKPGQQPSAEPKQPVAGSEADDYVLGLEDVISIHVWKEPELSVKDIIIRPDGRIGLPLINDIRASGLTPKQLQEEISEKLKEFISSPVVTVVVVKAASHSVSIVGQVNKPDVYPMGSPMTVLELLAKAGGLTEYAKAKDIKIIRKEDGKTVQFSFNFKDVSKGKNLQQNIILKNGDTVVVP